MGEFYNGSLDEIKEKIKGNSKSETYKNPTQTLPVPPPNPPKHIPPENVSCCKCCEEDNLWMDNFKETVDDLLLKSNIHTCGDWSTLKNGKENTRFNGCQSNKEGKCKARFPREIFPETTVDDLTGNQS